MVEEKATWRAKATVEKYDDEGNLVETVVVEPGNILVNAGINQLLDRLVLAEQVWDNTHVGLAVGNGTAAAAAGDTDLAGASKRYNAMEAGYPTVGTRKLTVRAAFAAAEANFAWQEYGVVVADTATAFVAADAKPANYILLNRKVQSLGTKDSGTWTLTVEITIA
jgi:hypothetical protein